MSRATYSDQDRATVFAHLTANGGNVKRTARETDLPVSTVRDWKRIWEKEGLPEGVQEALVPVVEDLVEDFTRVRNKGLVKMEEQIEDGTMKGQALVNAVGMLTDKIRLFKGEATSRTESRMQLPEPQRIRELVGDFFREAVESAQDRADVIDDAEWEPAQLEALPPAEEELVHG